MKKGDTIRITLYGHSPDCEDSCPCEDSPCGGVHTVAGRVLRVLPDNFVEAEITDPHPLALHNGNPRILTVSPELYA